MGMTIQRCQSNNEQYDIKCKFFTSKLRQTTSTCNLGITNERLYWDMDYSSKVFLLHQTKHVDIPKSQIKELAIKKVYAKEWFFTCLMILFFLLYFMGTVWILFLSGGETQWLMMDAELFLAGTAVAALLYLTSRISVLQITTVDKKTYRMPFILEKKKKDYEEAVVNELLAKLKTVGLKDK